MWERSGPTLAALGLGAALMYFLDTSTGRRRRALMRNRLTHATRRVRETVGATSRDVAHRTSGLAARVRRFGIHAPVDDVVLIERVRAQLGRAVSHPGAIAVNASNGVVRLRGVMLRAEMPRLLRTIKNVRGVRDVDYQLELHNM